MREPAGGHTGGSLRRGSPVRSAVARCRSTATVSPGVAIASFVQFGCPNCGSKMKVPSAFSGKRVRCPGCQQAAEVPSGVAAGAAASELSAMDLSLLDDESGGGGAAAKPRRIRDLLIGCGACEKTVKIPENRCGSVVRCPRCDARLRVDCPPPPPGTGKTVDFRHLSLDPVDEPALDDAGGSVAGSLAGRSSGGSLSGSLSGASASGAAMSGRDQMAELRTLNDLLADGSISRDEHKKRRAEVMTGGSATGAAARAATSRATGGVSERALPGGRSGWVPGPVKTLLVLGIVGAVGYAVVVMAVLPLVEEVRELGATQPTRRTPVPPAPRPKPVETASAEAGAPDAPDAPDPPVPLVSPEPADPSGDPRAAVEPAVVRADPAGEPLDAAPPAPAELAVALATPDPADGAAPPPEPSDPPPPGAVAATPPGSVAFWPVMHPEHDGSRFPLAAMSDRTLRMTRPDGTADLGVIVGPRLAGDDTQQAETLLRFNLKLRRELVNGIAALGATADSVIEAAERPRAYGPLEDAVITEVRSRNPRSRGDAALVAVAAQSGHAVAYWFSGRSRLLAEFEREVAGTAVIE